MSAVEGLTYGLSLAVQPELLLAALIGAIAGTIIGLLPGLGPTAGAAVLLPLTYTMSPTAALVMIAAIYYAVMYGGSTSAVLLNIPGEAPSVVSSFEGYPMAKQGRAGPALFIITAGSFLSGTVAVILVTFLTPMLSRVGLLFGPAEFFAITLGGLLVLSRVMGGSWASGMIPMVLGLVLGTIGEEGVTGRYRFTYGILELTRGLDLVAIAIGLFGITELLVLAKQKNATSMVGKIRVRDLLPTRDDLRRSIGPWLRGSPIGFFFGLLPGPSATLATFASYRVEKAVSKRKHLFGTGVVEGLAGPEAANNSAATSSVIPVLALGIPFSATLALMLSALVVHGVTPGPLLIEQHPEIFWGLIGSLYIGNVILVILNVPLIGVWVSFLRTPYHLLIPIVTVLAFAGSFSARRSYVDLYAILALGALGYLFRKIGYQLAPLLVGFILGPLMERNLREGLILSRGSISYLFTEAIAMWIWVLVLLTLMISGIGVARTRRKKRRLSASQVGLAPLDDD
ncbi:MAG: tripartite tricarboxylate transporter permease [Chloroflexota bacterium]